MALQTLEEKTTAYADRKTSKQPRVNITQKIHGANRLVIVTFSLIGMVLDGLNPADIFMASAIIQWLWWCELDQFEAALIGRLFSGSCRNQDLRKAIAVNN